MGTFPLTITVTMWHIVFMFCSYDLNPSQSAWSTERVEALSEHHRLGLTAAQSAILLGTTKNAVIAKRYRLGLVVIATVTEEFRGRLPDAAVISGRTSARDGWTAATGRRARDVGGAPIGPMRLAAGCGGRASRLAHALLWGAGGAGQFLRLPRGQGLPMNGTYLDVAGGEAGRPGLRPDLQPQPGYAGLITLVGTDIDHTSKHAERVGPEVF